MAKNLELPVLFGGVSAAGRSPMAVQTKRYRVVYEQVVFDSLVCSTQRFVLYGSITSR